jgi:hypothetical protein
MAATKKQDRYTNEMLGLSAFREFLRLDSITRAELTRHLK